MAVGVVTGLIQEFEFGMNWSAYSRFVGDVFGAPLAMEGLAAFFLESTFIGLWVFGWNVLPRGIHLLTVWLVAAGAARLGGVHHGGELVDAAPGRVHDRPGDRAGRELSRHRRRDDQPGVPVGLRARADRVAGHRVASVMLAVSAWYLRRKSARGAVPRSAKVSIAVLLPSILLALGVGSHLGVIEATYQPMKISAAEAQWETCQPCSFSAFQIGGGNNDQTPTKIIEIPHLLSILATGTWNGEVQGLNELNAQYQEEYGPGNYVPNVFVQYWSMRVMAYLGLAGRAARAVGPVADLAAPS